MKNIVGKPVSGDNFFPRNSVIEKIYRKLDGGDNLFMAAPRRVGKTSIMYWLKDNPRKNYVFIYVNTESINSIEDFFKKLFDELLESDAIKGLIKASEKSKSIFESVTKHLKNIKVYGVEVAFNNEDKMGNFSNEFKNLLEKLDTEGVHIVMMIDEFPSTIENIKALKGDAEAIYFLQLNREMRQIPNSSIQFIYTGSIGLPIVVSRIHAPTSINDLNTIEVTPLSEQEGEALAVALLTSNRVPFQPTIIPYLLEKVKWLMPFFIQLAVQELIDEYDNTKKEIDKAAIESAFNKICNRRNNVFLESYHTRLKKAFTNGDYELALSFLEKIAVENSVTTKILFKNAKNDDAKKQYRSILRTLEFDGYIFNDEENYSFNSPILQEWWKLYMR